MKEESKTKKLSLTKKQKTLLAVSVILFLILCLEMVLILYAKKNKGTDVNQERRSKKIVAELQEEEELVIREEEMVEDVDKPSSESSKSTTPETTTPESSTPSSEIPTPRYISPKPIPKILPPRERVESLWTPDATSVIIDSKETTTINGTKYLTVTVRRGTLKVGDTLKQTGICGIVPDVSTKITKMMKAGKLVNSATVSESVGIAMDNDYFYKRATFGTDMQLATKVKLKVYVFTKEEGNTEEQSVVNNQGYILSFIPENPSGRAFIVGNGTPVISKPINPGEVADIEMRKFIMLGGPALYEPGTRIKVQNQHTNKQIGIGVITGYPPCPHK
ncbi:MAG TPA: hypothetical protein VJY47_03655 [Candidatus Dojkabacteria bacterium]|nr:hypothetical protein [Candidatus Dojkabacteria bacterium]